MKMDFFEIERVIEEVAKNYAAPCTTKLVQSIKTTKTINRAV